jgi:NAD(P)-dependent dehydrogenase (short-subunit alcohol dehydrogenase family)
LSRKESWYEGEGRQGCDRHWRGAPSDIAAAVAFLLSEATGFMTGAELIIDGGMTRKMIYVE